LNQNVSFTILGSGTGLPDANRGPAGFLLQVDNDGWLIDGGSGTVQKCAKAGFNPRQLRGGFYSHRHIDHVGDLPSLLFAMRMHPPRTSDYPIYAGLGMAGHVERLRSVYGKHVDPGDGSLVIHEVPIDEPVTVDVGPFLLHTAPAVHGHGALHLGFEIGDVRIVFSGDTGPSEHLVQLAKGADLLVCECAFPIGSEMEGHLTPASLRDVIHRAKPRETWITHLYPNVDVKEMHRILVDLPTRVHRASDGDTWRPQ
jgi:ribonuclease BN (tRNA processing enzyme)